MPVVNGDGCQTIAYLGTELLSTASGNIAVKVFRKSTHIDKYLTFDSHSHVNDKKAVIKTWLDRAKSIPSSSTIQARETENVLHPLQLNGYKKRLIEEVIKEGTQANRNEENEIRSSACLPYVKVKNILTKAGVRVPFKLIRTLANIFRIPKTIPSEERTKAVVYKYECKSCSFS
jgi:hypothetical protein